MSNKCVKIYENICDVSKIIDEIKNIEQMYNYAIKTKVWSSLPLRTIDGAHDSAANILKPIGTQSRFQNTELLNKCPYIKSVLESLNTEIYLVRILKLAAHGKINEHIDNDFKDGINTGYIRCHIPIITNDKVEFYIQQEKFYLDIGSLWYTDVSKKHWVINNSNEDRIHIVLDIKITDEISKIIDVQKN